MNTSSIITTIYSGDNLSYVSQALDSIECQIGLSEVRVYLHIDGELPQGHAEFINKNKHRFYKIIYSHENIGLARGLNKLLDIVEEDFIFRMDLDDLSTPERFQSQVNFLLANPEIDLVGSNAICIDENNSITSYRILPPNQKSILKTLPKIMPILNGTFCIRKKIIDRGLRYPDVYLTEDLAFLHAFFKHGYLAANLQEYLYKWRLDSNFFLRRNHKRSWVEFKTYISIIFDFYPLSYYYAYPIARLLIRLLPIRLAKLLYSSKLRNSLSG
ncbi:glycosyltransferase [Pseudomonas fragi]|uniref:glycosyltransferase n=1 Tax=Pseudomonas fragi TaxID=296 RepID=UPI002005C639|nr:glycosyltransferase [Pseudomonas fragi]